MKLIEYSISEVVFLKIEKIPPALLRELKEFLRTSVIIPIRNEYGDNNSSDVATCYFSGFFVKKSAESIEKWLQENGFQEAQKL